MGCCARTRPNKSESRPSLGSVQSQHETFAKLFHVQRQVSVDTHGNAAGRLSQNLPFRRQHRMICRVASMGEGSPVLCAPHVDGGRPSLVCHEPPCDGSVASPLPLLAQEVLQLVHELLRVHVLLTPWGRRLGTRRVIGLL